VNASGGRATQQPAPVTREVVRATAADHRQLVRLLERAFRKEELVSFFVKQDARLVERGQRYFDVLLRQLGFPQGEVYRTRDSDGAALWFPPGFDVPVLGLLRYALEFSRVCGALRSPATFTALARMMAKHPRQPHWYLMHLGVDPERQGRGIGTALLRPVLERCDRERVPAYLETSTELNLVLYRRHGFEVFEEWTVPCGGPGQWRMWREPR
jgi:ribosomal protein S18 acetylase RimI-like enzyme